MYASISPTTKKKHRTHRLFTSRSTLRRFIFGSCVLVIINNKFVCITKINYIVDVCIGITIEIITTHLYKIVGFLSVSLKARYDGITGVNLYTNCCVYVCMCWCCFHSNFTSKLKKIHIDSICWQHKHVKHHKQIHAYIVCVYVVGWLTATLLENEEKEVERKKSKPVYIRKIK